MKEFSLPSTDFIAGWYIDDPFICYNIIKFSTKSTIYVERGNMSDGEIDLNRNNSFDLGFNSDDHREPLVSYKKLLREVLELYKDTYEYCSKEQRQWDINEGYNIQT